MEIGKEVKQIRRNGLSLVDSIRFAIDHRDGLVRDVEPSYDEDDNEIDTWTEERQEIEKLLGELKREFQKL